MIISIDGNGSQDDEREGGEGDEGQQRGHGTGSATN
jgi:hypothetical protein